jgi:hypothetical protein
MKIDVTTQTNGYDLRERGGRVRLPPEVIEVSYTTRRGTIDIVRGTRDKIASALRAAGYAVEWIDDNPARVLGAMTSPRKAETARANGAKHKGTKRKAVAP